VFSQTRRLRLFALTKQCHAGPKRDFTVKLSPSAVPTARPRYRFIIFVTLWRHAANGYHGF
jgi:hypothetical protein